MASKMKGGSSVWSKMAAATKQRKDDREAGRPPAPMPAASAPSQARMGGGTMINVRRKQVAAPPVIPMELTQFSWDEVLLGSKRGANAKTGVPPMVPLHNPTQGPMCIELKGGGSIHPQFGISQTNYGKTKMQFTVDGAEERKALQAMEDSLRATLEKHKTDWYPEFEQIDVTESTRGILGEVKAKKDGGEYAPIASCNINEYDLDPNRGHPPELTILNHEGNAVMNLQELPGQRWTNMVLQLEWLVLGISESEDGKPRIPFMSLSRRVRFLQIAIDETTFHHVFPEDGVTHDPNCKRKHHVPVPINAFSFGAHASVGELKTKDKATSARIEALHGGDLILKMTGGGVLPPFCIDKNQQDNFTFTWSVESKDDETALDAISVALQDYIITNRDVYFPKSTLQDQMLRMQVKDVLHKSSENPKYVSMSRNMSCIFEPARLGNTLRMVDGTGNPLVTEEDIFSMVGKRWKEVWVHCRSIYRQAKNKLFEIGFSTRLVYAALAPENADYVIQPLCRAPKRAAITNESADQQAKDAPAERPSQRQKTSASQ